MTGLDFLKITPVQIPEILELDNICFEFNDLQKFIESVNLFGDIYVLTNQVGKYILGYLLVFEYYNINNPYAYIIRVGVYPKFRSQGFANEMLSRTIQRFRHESKIKKIECDVRFGNEASRNLFTKHGFYNVALKDGMYQDGEICIRMQKHL